MASEAVATPAPVAEPVDAPAPAAAAADAAASAAAPAAAASSSADIVDTGVVHHELHVHHPPITPEVQEKLNAFRVTFEKDPIVTAADPAEAAGFLTDQNLHRSDTRESSVTSVHDDRAWGSDSGVAAPHCSAAARSLSHCARFSLCRAQCSMLTPLLSRLCSVTFALVNSIS